MFSMITSMSLAGATMTTDSARQITPRHAISLLSYDIFQQRAAGRLIGVTADYKNSCRH